MGRVIAVVATVAFLTACQSSTPPVVASPLSSPAQPTAPTDAILQSADVPAGLSACLGSGPIDVYISTLADADAAVAGRLGAQWEQLRAGGATAGAISLFTASPAACNADLATTANTKSIVSFVAEFADPGQADRAWASGVFGFAPPASGEILAGVTRGNATGLGLSSWVYDRPPVRLASWHKSVFVALVVAGNLDGAAFTAATMAVDARLN